MAGIKSQTLRATQSADDSMVNAMSGGISYEDLAKVEGISTIALKVKKEASSSFFKKSTTCPLSKVEDKYISYKNVKLLRRFISPRGKIVAVRNSNVQSRKKQVLLRQAILRARFLGLLPYVKY
jgi:small subunit ribosomal protein S18